MNYYLINNIASKYYTVLVDAKWMHEILQSYSDVEYLMSECTNEPKFSWIEKGDPLNVFNVPLLDKRDTDEIYIVDGRHRICWMIRKGMDRIPIAIPCEIMDFLKSINIDFSIIDILDMPCNIIPALQPKLDDEVLLAEVKELIARIARKSSE